MNEWRKISLREVIEINPASVGSDFKAEWIEYIDISSVGEGAITESPKVIKLKVWYSPMSRQQKSKFKK